MTLVLCLITGFVYPGVVTVLAQLTFPRQANGSLVTVRKSVKTTKAAKAAEKK